MYMENYNKVVDYLFVGNDKSPFELYDDVDLIVNCTNNIILPHVIKNVITLSVKDDPIESDNLFDLIIKTNILEKIHAQILNKKSVLIFCQMGSQRSCTVVACYLIKYYNMQIMDTINYIRAERQLAFFGSVHFMKTIEKIYQLNHKNKL